MNRRYSFYIFIISLIIIFGVSRVSHVTAMELMDTVEDNISEDEFFIYLPLIMNQGINNGGFESGNDGAWSLYSFQGFIEDIIYMPTGQDSVQPHNGDYLAWLGGYQNELTQVSQNIFIGPNASNMSFWYWVESSDDCGNDLFTIKVNGTSIYDQDLCVNENSSNWERKILDLSTYTNSTIELLFEVTTNETSLNDPYGSSLYLDDISLQ